MDIKKVDAERERLRGLLEKHVGGGKMELADAMVDNLAFDAVRLEEMRSSLTGQTNVVGYDNGGGQSGFKKNPELELYMSLTKQYQSEVRQIAGLFEECAAGDTGESVLKEILDGRGAA